MATIHPLGFTQCASDPCIFTLQRTIDGVQQRLILGCYVDDLFLLYTHDGDGSYYEPFTSAPVAHRWNIEDEGPVSDLLNVEITVTDGTVELTQSKYIDSLVEAYLPDGIPTSFHVTYAPAAGTLPSLVESARCSARTLYVARRRVSLLFYSN
eukprot:2626178-Pleurochrysis_carterae.AAC.1